MYGSGSIANVPNRPGCWLSSFFAYSLDSRASRAASSAGKSPTCGVVGDVMAVATPPLSISSIVFCTDQFVIGGLSFPMRVTALSHVGGTM